MQAEVRGHLVAHAAVLVVALLGTVFFFALYEGAPWLTSFYYVAMIITLVGSNYEPRTTAGVVVAVLLAFLSVSVFLSLVGQVFGPQLISALRRTTRMTRLTHMKDHIIILASSDTSWAIARETTRPHVLLVQSTEDFEKAERHGISAVRGDPTHALTLEDAGIHRCSMLLATSDDDALNAFVTLTAKRLVPGLRVVARISREDNREKLIAAGANEVVCPATLAAKHFLRDAETAG